MSLKIILKGITWDHPRGYEPLRATSQAFSELHKEVIIEWVIRTLKEFGDMPIENLIEAYDLITIDHPYMGQAHENQLLISLENAISHRDLEELEQNSVGPSFASYRFKGHLYALPIDAAALVAAFRRDLIETFRIELPTVRADLFNLYSKIPKGHNVAWALCPTDLWCTFLTLCAQDAGNYFIKNQRFDEKLGAAILNELKEHLNYLHPESMNWNPIQILDVMASADEIVYAPFLFGYSNYSRTGFADKLVLFTNSPTNPKNSISTILGGVGLAVSSNSKNSDWAVAFARFTANGLTQKGLYTLNGGQPGHLEAWKCPKNHALCHGFFLNTLPTMEKAYVRPQHPGWNKFQEQAADMLHDGIKKDIPSDKMMKGLNQLYKSIL